VEPESRENRDRDMRNMERCHYLGDLILVISGSEQKGETGVTLAHASARKMQAPLVGGFIRLDPDFHG